MSTLEIQLRKYHYQEFVRSSELEGDSKWLFSKWRQRLLNAYLAWMRHHDSIAFQNSMFPDHLRIVPEPSRQWCNAAILILTHRDEDDWALFLTSPIEKKNKLVNAILEDGGLWTSEGTWQELPE